MSAQRSRGSVPSSSTRGGGGVARVANGGGFRTGVTVGTACAGGVAGVDGAGEVEGSP
jgi:hypothetical protein